MKCTIPEISWHNREPVLSVDIHPVSTEFYRLASGGGDSHVLIWHMSISDNGAVKQEVVSDLTRHQKAVNAVRWSPSGHYLASGDDDANIILWQLKNDNIPLLEGDSGDKEIWMVHKILRGHKEDIYDLCWSVSEQKLLSGSIDNTAILWDLTKGKMDHILTDHKGFVQGVAWDPKNQLIATISTDRICRLFDTSGKLVRARISKGKLPVSTNHFLYNKEVKYFHDDTFKSFFRRLQFSPDGSMLVVPSGHMENDEKILMATLIFTLDNVNQPSTILPLPKQCSTCVRFCPILFKLREDGPTQLIDLPYRMIFAVGTDHDVILYDTQQGIPFARFHEIHYTRLTDLTWSSDGLLLIASSTDGFCALITFEQDELGTQHIPRDTEKRENAMDVSINEANITKEEDVDANIKDVKEKAVEKTKQPSFLEKWASTPKKNKKDKELAKPMKSGEEIEIIDDDADDPRVLSQEIKDEINRLIPRRIKPISVEKTDNVVAKLIQVRRAPRTVENGEHQENCSETEKSTAAIPIEVRKGPRDVQRMSESSLAKHLDAKPIEVRRKPRSMASTPVIFLKSVEPSNSVTEGKNKTEQSVVNSANENSEVINMEKRQTVVTKSTCTLFKTSNKSIATEKTKSTERPVSSDIKNIGTQKIEKKLVVVLKNTNKSKSTENDWNVEKIKNEIKASTKNRNESDKKERKGKSATEKVLKKQDKQNSVKSQLPIVKIKLKDTKNETPRKESVTRRITPARLKLTNEETPNKQSSVVSTKKSSGKRKREDTPKSKTGSSARKKLPTTPQSNSILNFLNNSANKKKAVQTMVPEKIDVTLDEEEARDGWSKFNLLENNPKSPELEPMEEDCTEDFCLQLEDSQQEQTTEKIDGESVLTIKSSEKGKSSEVIDLTEDSNDTTSTKNMKGNSIDASILQKVPRRVPLITLASPKGKNKQTPDKA